MVFFEQCLFGSLFHAQSGWNVRRCHGRTATMGRHRGEPRSGGAWSSVRDGEGSWRRGGAF